MTNQQILREAAQQAVEQMQIADELHRISVGNEGYFRAKYLLKAALAQPATAQAEQMPVAQWSYAISPPKGFIDYVAANYSGEVVFHDPEWHALRLWNAAMKHAAYLISMPAVATPQPQPTQEEIDEDAFVIHQLSKLLASVAIALKGEEAALHRHSFHDLPELARLKMLEIEVLKAQLKDATPAQPSEKILRDALERIKHHSSQSVVREIVYGALAATAQPTDAIAADENSVDRKTRITAAPPIQPAQRDSKDAARYRWLRDDVNWTVTTANDVARFSARIPVQTALLLNDTAHELDTAIDAAITAQEKP